MSHVKLTGYFAMVAAVTAVVSGLVLTFQALFQTRIGYVWDAVHIVATFALIAAAIPHIVVLLVNRTKQEATKPLAVAQRRFMGATALVVAVPTVAVGLLWYAHEPEGLPGHDVTRRPTCGGGVCRAAPPGVVVRASPHEL